MTFSNARESAKKASGEAKLAVRDTQSDDIEHLAKAVQYLADAVAELASSLHQSDIG